MKPRLIRKALIVYKKSSYQSHALDRKDKNFLKLLKERSIVLQRSKSTHDTHIDSFETIKRHLKNLKIPFDVKHRYELKKISGYDLVIAIGGDGTFLETSHFLADGILMGVNSVPHESVGFFCRSTAETFLEKIYEYVNETAKIQTLHRIEIEIDGKLQWPLALNEILFASQNPAGTTRYVLKVGRKSEEQKSSGLWISTAAGSTAAIKSAGGAPLPLDSKKIEYMIREPYEPHGKKYHLLKQILSPGRSIEILSMMDDAAIFVDGPHIIYPVMRGSIMVVRHAVQPLQVLW